MPKPPKNKMVSKQCPKCEQQVPVACKNCPCGHVFFITRRPISIHKIGGKDDSTGEVKRRRTERLKRERPDFYNALEIESQLKKLHRRCRKHKSSSSTSTSTADFEDVSNSEEGSAPKRRGRPKISLNRERKSESSDKEEDIFTNIPAEKALQYSVILAEINRKLIGTQFKI